MKYFEFTFRTHPCTEIVTDVLAAVARCMKAGIDIKIVTLSVKAD